MQQHGGRAFQPPLVSARLGGLASPAKVGTPTCDVPWYNQVFGIETQEPEQTQTLSSGHELQTGGGNGLTSQRLLAILQVLTLQQGLSPAS